MKPLALLCAIVLAMVLVSLRGLAVLLALIESTAARESGDGWPLVEKARAALAANQYEGTRLPWKDAAYWSNGGGIPTSGFYIPGHNDGKQVEMMTVDADLIVAAVNALPTLLENLAPLPGTTAPSPGVDWSGLEKELLSVMALMRHDSPEYIALNDVITDTRAALAVVKGLP